MGLAAMGKWQRELKTLRIKKRPDHMNLFRFDMHIRHNLRQH